MSNATRPIRIWLIEDSPQERKRALDAINEAIVARDIKADVKTAPTVSWPPQWSEGMIATPEPPDLVVLDLFDGTQFKGDNFYYALRELERRRLQPASRVSLIIAWTKTALDKKKLKPFLDDTRTNDLRFLNCPKDQYSLRTTVESCLRRIQEERDWEAE